MDSIMSTKSGKTMIILGVLTLLHGLMHLLQFVQSVLLLSFSISKENNWLHKLMENPYFGLLWAVVGLIALVTGVKDFRNKKHGQNIN